MEKDACLSLPQPVPKSQQGLAKPFCNRITRTV